MPKRKSLKCSKCGSTNIARYVYGLPSDDALEKEKDNIIWAGCCISGNDPEYHCKDCGTDFDEDMNVWEKTIEDPKYKPVGQPLTRAQWESRQKWKLLQDFIMLILFILAFLFGRKEF